MTTDEGSRPAAASEQAPGASRAPGAVWDAPRAPAALSAPAEPVSPAAAVAAAIGEDDATWSRLRTLLPVLVRGARGAGVRALTTGKWLTDLVIDVAPQVPLRDLATLQRQHPTLGREQLADLLVMQAARASAAIGAVGGVVATVEVLAPPTLVALPVEVLAETALVVALELKLVGELHAVYERPIGGSPAERGTSLLRAWAEQRGIPMDLHHPAAIVPALTKAVRGSLTRRLLLRVARASTTAAPVVGAVAASALNRRATRKLGRAMRADLVRSAAGRSDVARGRAGG